jgi:hypothetical protein
MEEGKKMSDDYQHPPRAQECANKILKREENHWPFSAEGTLVLSPSDIDVTVRKVTALTEKALEPYFKEVGDDKELGQKESREAIRKMPGSSPEDRKYLQNRYNQYWQLYKEAIVRELIYNAAKADIHEGGCKEKNVDGSDCKEANKSFVDYCWRHAPKTP